MTAVTVYHAKRDATFDLVVVQVEGRAPVPFDKHMTEVLLRTLRGPRRRELLRDLVTDRFVSCFETQLYDTEKVAEFYFDDVVLATLEANGKVIQ